MARPQSEAWYQLCLSFYVHHDPNGRDAIQWFQNHSPHSDQRQTEEILHPETENCYRQCGILDCDEEQWYQLDRIKNQARLAAHNEGTKHRINDLLCEGQVQNRTQQQVTLSATKHLLQRVLSDLKADLSLGSIVDLMADWIRQQLQYQTCTIVTLSASALTERQPEISHHLLLLLCAIGRFIVPNCFVPISLSDSISGMPIQYHLSPDTPASEVQLQWIMKEDLSDSFLRALLKNFPTDLRTAKRNGSRGGATLEQSERYRDIDNESKFSPRRKDNEEVDENKMRRLCFCCF
jgi:hypothetical protein